MPRCSFLGGAGVDSASSAPVSTLQGAVLLVKTGCASDAALLALTCGIVRATNARCARGTV